MLAIPSNFNIQKKATEKMSKYVDLQIECQRIWNKKVEVIPVIIGSTGIVDKNIKKYKHVGFSFCLIFNEMTDFLFNRIDFL